MRPETLRWTLRTEPLTPVGVFADGVRARTLARRIVERDPPVSGLVVDDGLLVLGPTDALPWIDGATWLGQDPDAPRLLVPTRLAPSAPAPLVARAVASAFPRAEPPWVLLPARKQAISAASAGPFDRLRLAAWAGA